MDFKEKARIKTKHWLEHNDKHCEEYLKFIKELEDHGLVKEKETMEKIVDLTRQISRLFKEVM